MKYLDLRKNEEKEFTVKKGVSLSDKIALTQYVAEMVVSEELGYMSILRDVFFDYAILQYYTDIIVFENQKDFSIDELDKFLKANIEMMNKIKEEIGVEEVKYMLECCNELIKFRCKHYKEYKDDIGELLETVRELVVKPDYMSELLKAITEWVNTVADNEIDLDIVTKLAEIVPMMKDMGSVEVAKAIIDNKDNIVSMLDKKD